jgi:hypothetical protein
MVHAMALETHIGRNSSPCAEKDTAYVGARDEYQKERTEHPTCTGFCSARAYNRSRFHHCRRLAYEQRKSRHQQYYGAPADYSKNILNDWITLNLDARVMRLGRPLSPPIRRPPGSTKLSHRMSALGMKRTYSSLFVQAD